MKILVLHNSYQQRGGEDSVVAAEVDLLRSAGHLVHLEIISNVGLSDFTTKYHAFLNTPHDPARRDWVRALVKATGAEVVHIHNFFPLLTPAVHEGAAEAGAAVVQTLHNYRLLCANAMFLRAGKICEKCLHGSKGWAVAHRCYRNSLPASLAIARMQWRAARANTWAKHVDRFIALTHFAARKFIEGGIHADQIVVKPNSTSADAPSHRVDRRGGLFVGRLSSEKGVASLIEAWRALPNLPLVILGDGPERARLEADAPSNVMFKGSVEATEVKAHMRSAAFMVMPSVWYEGFPMTVVEAYACGLPVIGSDLGSLAEIIRDGDTGRLYIPGNASELANTVLGLTDDDLSAMSENAFAAYNRHYTPSQNLSSLEKIYNDALVARRHRRSHPD